MTKEKFGSYATSAAFVVGTAVVITNYVRTMRATKEMHQQIRQTVKKRKQFDREFKNIVRNY